MLIKMATAVMVLVMYDKRRAASHEKLFLLRAPFQY